MRVQITDDLDTCISVRHEVFVVGQQVPLEEEVDGRDPECTHFLATVDGEVAGTARLRVSDGQGKAERVAVLERFRGRGVGSAVMTALEEEARRRGLQTVVLGAQVQVIPFYEGLGYSAYGELFLDANIQHRMMRKGL